MVLLPLHGPDTVNMLWAFLRVRGGDNGNVRRSMAGIYTTFVVVVTWRRRNAGRWCLTTQSEYSKHYIVTVIGTSGLVVRES